MKNFNQMMKQVKKMQAQMEKAQEELAQRTFEGTAGGGVVTVIVNGKKEVQQVIIKPEAVDPDDVDMLQDLITAAANDALKKVDEAIASDLGKIAGGLNIPGLF
ncbi:MAG: nucleoid-associated protein [Bacillaceae bacterium G1]|nr:YbaB/EbfC family nucleoid-associated protein [Bacillota bacterium]OJF17682.1 MAG: nucleoid-associated protein [Bacillaceae bacterium G1]